MSRFANIVVFIGIVLGLIFTFSAPFAFAAVAATNLDTTGTNVDSSSFNSDSFTPTANDLVLAWIYTISATADATPTATSFLGPLTWTMVGSIDDQGNGTGLRRLTLFRAMSTTSALSSVTFDYAAQTQTGAAWSIVQYGGVDTSGTNGAGAVVQSALGHVSGTATSLTVTLGAFGSASNATAGGFGMPLNTAGLPAVGSGYTATGQRNQSTPNLSMGSEFLASNNTAVNMTSAASSVPWTGIAVEIKATGGASTSKVPVYWIEQWWFL